jgi:hypothetical protein
MVNRMISITSSRLKIKNQEWPIKAYCDYVQHARNGIEGYEDGFVAQDGTMPQSLNSVGLTQMQASLLSYIVIRLIFTCAQIAHIIPRCKKTGLYLCPLSQFVQLALGFLRDTRPRKEPARKVHATDPVSESNGKKV